MFYHAHVRKKKRSNHVDMLKLSSGEWSSDGSVLKADVVRYFCKLYKRDMNSGHPWMLTGQFLQLSFKKIEALAKNVDNEEIHVALFPMGPLKAPGIDGMQALFLQKNWDVVGESVCGIVRVSLKVVQLKVLFVKQWLF